MSDKEGEIVFGKPLLSFDQRRKFILEKMVKIIKEESKDEIKKEEKKAMKEEGFRSIFNNSEV